MTRSNPALDALRRAGRTMSTMTASQIAADNLAAYIGESDTTDGFDRDDMIAFATAAIEADRAQRSNEVYVIQSEEGDIVDVTTSREWADWQTRTDDDNPIRTRHDDTLWDGPEDRSDWS